MFPIYVLLDILKCLDRDGLANIQVTNRVINNIIERDFASKPLRLFDETILLGIFENKNDEMQLAISRSKKGYVTTIPEWQDCKFVFCCEKQSCSIDELRPFMPKYMRFRNVEIDMDKNDNHGFSLYTPEQVTLLESISHIWTGQMLTIFTLHDSDCDIDSLKRVYESSAILRCHSLLHYNCSSGVKNMTSALMENYQCSNLYTLHTIYFSWFIEDNILRLTRYKAAFPQSDTMFVFALEYAEHFQKHINVTFNALETIKKEFLAASAPSRLRMIFEIILVMTGENEFPEKLDFRLENRRTKEALQLKRITMQEAKEKYNVDLYKHAHDAFQGFTDGVDGQAFFLERFAT